MIGIHCQANEARYLQGKRKIKQTVKEAVLDLWTPLGLIQDRVQAVPLGKGSQHGHLIDERGSITFGKMLKYVQGPSPTIFHVVWC